MALRPSGQTSGPEAPSGGPWG